MTLWCAGSGAGIGHQAFSHVVFPLCFVVVCIKNRVDLLSLHARKSIALYTCFLIARLASDYAQAPPFPLPNRFQSPCFFCWGRTAAHALPLHTAQDRMRNCSRPPGGRHCFFAETLPVHTCFSRYLRGEQATQSATQVTGVRRQRLILCGSLRAKQLMQPASLRNERRSWSQYRTASIEK